MLHGARGFASPTCARFAHLEHPESTFAHRPQTSSNRTVESLDSISASSDWDTQRRRFVRVGRPDRGILRLRQWFPIPTSQASPWNRSRPATRLGRSNREGDSSHELVAQPAQSEASDRGSGRRVQTSSGPVSVAVSVVRSISPPHHRSDRVPVSFPFVESWDGQTAPKLRTPATRA